ncbi:cobalamin-binding protein [Candidatus Woesearchaeota archaeon]|nr:cobalamin-binding protein [Candidatus Woesearchaeota archaeon]
MAISRNELQAVPRRIISLAPSNTEILYALGLGQQVVAVTRFCDYPPAAKQKPKIGGWLDINDALLEQHKPELLFTSTFVQDKIVERLEAKGMQIIHTDPKNLKQVYGSILYIGDITGKKAEAEQLVEQMQQQMQEISDSMHTSKKPRVYVEEWHKPPTVSGNWVPDIVALAKGESMIPSGIISREVSFAEVQGFDPDFIIISWCGFGTRVDLGKFFLGREEPWKDLRAVKEGHINVFDDSLLNRPGPRLVKGLRLLVKTIHPKGKG